jgi:beta-lactamase class A
MVISSLLAISLPACALATVRPVTSLGRAPAGFAKLGEELAAVCKKVQGRMGYCLIDLKSGATIGYRMDERYPTASTIKTAIAVEAIRQVDAGKLKMTDQLPVPPIADRKEWEVSMWSYYLKEGVKLDLDGWVTLMITVSDNLATRVVREWVGVRNIVDSMESLGLPNTKNLSSAPESEPVLRKLNKQFGMGMTTPHEMARLLQLIYEGKAASPQGCQKIIRLLSHQYWDDLLGMTVPIQYKVSCKSGAINRSRSDTAIVFGPRPYVLTVYSDSLKDQRWVVDNPAYTAIRTIGVRAWNGLHPSIPFKPDPTQMKFVPTGSGIE